MLRVLTFNSNEVKLVQTALLHKQNVAIRNRLYQLMKWSNTLRQCILEEIEQTAYPLRRFPLF